MTDVPQSAIKMADELMLALGNTERQLAVVQAALEQERESHQRDLLASHKWVDWHDEQEQRAETAERQLEAALTTLPEKGVVDAPKHLSAEAAYGWACGWEAARAALASSK